jgi:hypothetical protein
MRKSRSFPRFVPVVVLLAVAALIGGTAGAQPQERIERGSTVQAYGESVTTWAKLGAGGRPIQAGVLVDFGLIENPPAEPGPGPAGAIAVAEFPKAVQSASFLNHFQLHWEREGHPPDPFRVPHFALHFYRVTIREVARISSPVTAIPDDTRVPAGYEYMGTEGFAPQMGVHAVDPADLEKPFTTALVLGYYGGKLTFLEPMVTREYLLQKKDFALTIPMPEALDGGTLYPTRLVAHYDRITDTYQFIFGDFVSSKR